MPQFKLEIITPEKKFFEGDVEAINVLTLNGMTQLLARHIAYATGLLPSVVKIKFPSEEKRAVITGGYLQFINNHAVIMADAAEWPGEIDIKRAEEAMERAKSRLKKRENDIDKERAKMALLRAAARIKASKIK